MPLSLHWTLNEREPVYVQIVRQVKAQLVSGQLKCGEVLPSRRELAVRLGINPNTAQKAYRQLEEEGVLSTEPNARSAIVGGDELLGRLRSELTQEAIAAFLVTARELGLDFHEVVRLLSENWQ